MFIPIHDENYLRSIRFQVVTIGLIVANVAVFMMQASGMSDRMTASFALVPSELLRVGLFGGPAYGPNDALAVPEGYTPFSYMFFHGDVFHLAGNMVFLWVFGDNVEDALGHVKFLIFYLACGVFAGFVHAWMLPGSAIPLIGASGAVAGVIAAYLMLHPRVRVWVLVFRFIPLRVTAGFALGAWAAYQVVMLLIPGLGPIAWWAHIGGLIAGAVLVLFLRRPGVPLFDRGIGLVSP